MRSILTFAIILNAGLSFAGTITWQQAVRHYAKLYKINSCIVFAIIDTESSGNPYVITVNYRGRYRSYKTKRRAMRIIRSSYQNIDIGLMQINYYWIRKKLKVTKSILLNPLYNIDIGEWLLKQLLVKYNNDYSKAVAVYHSSRVKEGSKYLRKVLRSYRNMSNTYCNVRLAEK